MDRLAQLFSYGQPSASAERADAGWRGHKRAVSAGAAIVSSKHGSQHSMQSSIGASSSDDDDASDADERMHGTAQQSTTDILADIRRMLALAKQRREKRALREELRRRTAAAWDSKACSAQLRLQCNEAQQRLSALQTANQHTQQQIQDVQQRVRWRHEQTQQRAAALSRAAAEARHARGCLNEADAILRSVAGVQHWQLLHRRLVTRRNAMVQQLGDVFDIGPSVVCVVRGGVVERMERSWAMPQAHAASQPSHAHHARDGSTAAAAVTAAGSSSASSDTAPSLTLERLQSIMSFSNHACDDSSLHNNALSMPPTTRALQVAARASDAASPHMTRIPSAARRQLSKCGAHIGEAVRLTIAGLELPDSLPDKILQGVIGWENSTADAAQISAALGYVALVVQRLSEYLDVPLRNPLWECASTSAVIDLMPPVNQRGVPANMQLQPLASWLQSHPHAAAGGEPVVLPLYWRGAQDGGSKHSHTRLAFAVYKLNSNIQQLLHAHGLSASGFKMLPNLYKLIAAASSGTQCTRHKI